MKKNLFILSLMSILLYAQGCNVRKNNAVRAILKERHQWMKEYALCTCLSLVGKQDTAFQNDISRAVYFDITAYNRLGGNNVYDAVDSLAYKAYNSITPTQIADYEGKKPYMMSCIEFSKSSELDSLIRSHDSQIPFDAIISARSK